MTDEELDDLLLDDLEGTLDAERRALLDRTLSRKPEAGVRMAELWLQESLLPLADAPLEAMPLSGGR